MEVGCLLQLVSRLPVDGEVGDGGGLSGDMDWPYLRSLLLTKASSI